MPDAELFDAAARGELATPQASKNRPAACWPIPRARQSVDEFVAEWLRFDRLLNAVKDRRRYPQFSPELAQSMTEETRRLVADAVWNDRDFMTIFTADYGFLNSDLATLYGVARARRRVRARRFPG